LATGDEAQAAVKETKGTVERNLKQQQQKKARQ